jgi:hypothetical protein
VSDDAFLLVATGADTDPEVICVADETGTTSSSQQMSSPEQEQNDRLGLRILLWTGKIVVGLVYVYTVLAMITIAFRFFLMMFGASPEAAFSDWIYTVSGRFMEPFQGMISIANPVGSSYIDVAALFAIAAYAIVAWLVHMLYEWIRHQLWKAERAS